MSYYGQETIQVADGDYLDTLARMAAEARKRNDPTIAIALSLDMIGMLVDEVVRSRAREPLAAELVRLRAVEKAAREQIAASDAGEELLDRATPTLQEMDGPEFEAMDRRLHDADRALRAALSADAGETHQHHWVDARNEVVSGGEVCPDCGAIRPFADAGETGT